AIRDGHVLVDGKPARNSHRVSPGEVISIRLPKPLPPKVEPEDIPLDILYEDADLVVLNKPAGMVTHPAYTHYSGTLVNALLHHWKGVSPDFPDPMRPGIVHRLDKDTSGIMVVAKNEPTLARLAKQFSERTSEREYWAIVWGRLHPARGTINASLGRSKSDRKKFAVSGSGKEASTDYEVIEEFGDLSLVRLKLRTGRTHQIRVHMHHLGHPVFGDPTYGGRRMPGAGAGAHKKERVQRWLGIVNRQALHAKTLGFFHPGRKERMYFDSDLPSDMLALLADLRALPDS
ncbi:MAG TPA: RluA family pseudouridine synthase, partial [Bacteroidota bacterium]|nr:RluA family pseudouridine synthase [Bacteroidota bacterium]